MSQICHKCAINPRKGISKDLIEYESCGDCKQGINPIECAECGQVLVYCKVMRYYQDTDPRTSKCGWFK